MLKNINLLNNNVLADLFKKYKTLKFVVEGHVTRSYQRKLDILHSLKHENKGWINVLNFDIFHFKNIFVKEWTIDNCNVLFDQSITGQPFLSLDPVVINFNNNVYEYTLGFFPNGQLKKEYISLALLGSKKQPKHLLIFFTFFLIDFEGKRQNVISK